MKTHALLVIGWSIVVSAAAHAGDWTMFRGPTRDGISAETNVPQKWDADTNIKWKTPLPGPGNSSPIVVGENVFITCATDTGKNRGLHCFTRADGRERWSKIVRYENEDPTHGTNPYCGSSPAAGNGRVVVWHGSAGVHCYDYDGKELWSRDLGEFRHIWGYGSSPVLYRDMVLLNCGPGARQFVIALDAATGKTLWQVDIPGGDSGLEPEEKGKKAKWTGSWSTPVVAKIDGQDQIIVGLPKQVQAFDPATGKVLWTCEGLGDLVYTDVLTGDRVGVAMSGYHGPAIGFKLGGTGDVTEANRLWRQTSQIPQRIGSGVLLGDYVFMVNEIGVGQCLKADTGEELWKARLPSGITWGSLVHVEGRLYMTDRQSKTIVFAANPERLEILAENELKEPTNSTPAFSNGQIFHRTFKNLYCIVAR
jgi:outer membrane protein assembly factor BamB